MTPKDHSRNVHLSWISPPAEDCNGDIIGYEVVVEGLHSTSTQTHSVEASTSLEIPDLTFMGYKFKVCAMTSAGRGPFSEEIMECKIANSIVCKNYYTFSLAMSYFGIVIHNS